MNEIGKIRKIKERNTPHGVIYTPIEVAKQLIGICKIEPNDIVLDPCKGLNGVFYDNLPPCRKDWAEVALGRNFFEYEGEFDTIIGNPPYSMWTKWLEKTISLNPKKIAYVFGSLYLTTIRLKMLEDSEYYLTKITVVNVRRWFSNTLLIVFKKEGTPIITYDTARY